MRLLTSRKLRALLLAQTIAEPLNNFFFFFHGFDIINNINLDGFIGFDKACTSEE